MVYIYINYDIILFILLGITSSYYTSTAFILIVDLSSRLGPVLAVTKNTTWPQVQVAFPTGKLNEASRLVANRVNTMELKGH